MKPRPNDSSALTRLKQLPPEDRAEIYAWAFPTGENSEPLTSAEIRSRLADRWDIQVDGQLSLFWSWQRRQAVLDHLGLMMDQDEQELGQQFPQASRDQLRAAALARGYAAADLMGDTDLSLKVVDRDLRDKQIATQRDKFEFDAAKMCLALLPELKLIAADQGLNEGEKVEQIRLKLFGIIPE